jgi:dipeptidyl aminopeptidase/acylaminoacyl peptidase
VAGTALTQARGPAQQATAKRPFVAKDWAALRNAAAAAVSPDGTILYLVTFGGDHGPTNKGWWTTAADGRHAAKLDLPEDFSPMGFTRDGHGLYGAWKVNKLEQLAIFPLKDGKAAAVPSTVVLLPRGIESAIPFPHGNRFAIVADPRPPDALEEVRNVQEPGEASLYVVNADGTGGQWWCSDLKNVSAAIPGSSPPDTAAQRADGESLAVLSRPSRIGHHGESSAIDVCSATGARHVTDIPNTVSGIAWADGGREIAFLSTKSAVLTPEHVWTVAAAGGVPEDRTPKLDGTAVQLAEDVRGHIWVRVNRGVRNEVDEFRNGALNRVYRWPDGVVGGPVRSEYADTSEQVALTVGDPTHASNVAVPEGDHLRRITHEGDEQLAAVELGATRVVQWTSKEGIALDGIATFPAGYVEGRKYPFLVWPHGGPEYNDDLSLDPFAQIIAGLGYVVLEPEYRGSTGYGADFMAAIYQHFGDRAYEDVDSATDYAITQGWADPNRLAICGWSAGGFMTAWTVTQTNRYKAAIEGAGVTDWAPFVWTSDLQQFDYDARWTDEDPEAFRKFSAVAFAYKVTTPLLILHGEADTRVPAFQGMEFFQILAARGKTVRMVTYPGAPHWPRLWEQRLNVFQEIKDWLGKYNK